MMGVLPSNKAGALIGAISALLVIVMCKPQPAEAGCSHLVNRATELRSARLLQALDKVLPVTTLTPSRIVETNYVARPSTPSQPLPCSGPSCSGHVPRPIPTTVIQVQVFEHWVVIKYPKEHVREPSRRDWDDEILPPHRGHSQSIFHPPRVLS
jgi:hypothetical protein